MKINEIVTEAFTKKVDRLGNFLSDFGSAIKSGAGNSKGVERATDFDRSKFNRDRETPGLYKNIDDVRAEKAKEKADAKAASKAKPAPAKVDPAKVDPAKATPAPSADNAPVKPKTFGATKIPAGHVLKVVMASKVGNVDYFRYPSGKWFVQWTTGSALQLITNPEDIENLNYGIPSAKVQAKIVALPTPTTSKANGGRK
jgi:hypothetical protein